MSQVYCTNCRHFYIDEEDFIPKCKHEEECDIRDCEDSRSLEERPCYEERVINMNIIQISIDKCFKVDIISI